MLNTIYDSVDGVMVSVRTLLNDAGLVLERKYFINDADAQGYSEDFLANATEQDIEEIGGTYLTYKTRKVVV